MRTTQRRRAVLVATLGFALVPFADPRPPEIIVLHGWPDTWTGQGLITGGMARQGFDLALTRYADRGWTATSSASSMVHSPMRDTASTWVRSPFLAVQRAE